MGNSSYTMMSHSPEWWMMYCHRSFEPSNQRLYSMSSEMEVTGCDSSTELKRVQVSSDHDDWKECGQHKSHGAAEWKCINCRRTFCGACKEFHDKMVPKKHHLLHRSKREKEAIILKEIFCNIHLNKELEMYCITDNRAICVLCALGPSHKDHTIEELEKSADKIRSDVGVLLANVDKDYPKMEEYLASVRKTIANASLPEYNDLVDKMMEKAIAQIKLNAANLKADENRKADKLKKKEADLKSQQEEIQSKLLSSRQFLETCTDLQLVTQGKRYLQELGDIVLPDMSNDERPGQLTEVDIQQHISRNIFS
ncbi:hypothetical protein FSP39_006876 [Pinctada imbricata]|uniref:B box-type domain-containing protein n=1 Tax=Pinctada imbricata TaxID=66713 RepID=A0AA88Y7K6_PINIB|nr:hypothetical protein FSP39_006876 [Pinctada imbricata]